jgi:hypothetical protein
VVAATLVASMFGLLLAAPAAEAYDGCTILQNSGVFPAEWLNIGLDVLMLGACYAHDNCYSQCNPPYGPYLDYGHKLYCDALFGVDLALRCPYLAAAVSYPIGQIENYDTFLKYCLEVAAPGVVAAFQLPIAQLAWVDDQRRRGCNPNYTLLSPDEMKSACAIFPCTYYCWGYDCNPECSTHEDCAWLYCNGPNDEGCSMYCDGGTCRNQSPIVVDVAGGGYKLTDVTDGVVFDLTGHGPQKISWTDPRKGNAWLVHDRNHNGVIDNGSELFGSYTPQPHSEDGPPNGFRALAVHDQPENGGNGNGRIDAGDRVYANLRLWIDGNQNGVSEPAELHPLEEFTIVAIDLAYRLSERRDRYGNRFRYRGDIIERDGARHGRTIWDVILLREQ